MTGWIKLTGWKRSARTAPAHCEYAHHKISHTLSWNLRPASAFKSRRLTAWATTQPQHTEKVRVKMFLWTPQGTWGVEVQLHLFLTSADGECICLRPGRSTPTSIYDETRWAHDQVWRSERVNLLLLPRVKMEANEEKISPNINSTVSERLHRSRFHNFYYVH
jgi:hypothetical protein